MEKVDLNEEQNTLLPRFCLALRFLFEGDDLRDESWAASSSFSFSNLPVSDSIYNLKRRNHDNDV